MAQDGLPTAEAASLAIRIIEYERTLEQERQSYSEDTGTSPVAQASGPASVERELLMKDDDLEGLRHFGGEDAPEVIAEVLKLRDRLLLWSARARVEQEISALRYRKRAASQIIKSLKGLA
jgi:hypothetical protein